MATNPANFPFFPAELGDLVVDASHDDREALATYALVCKQWLPRSRHHLFASATILADNARDFILLLSSPHCTFASALRRIEITLAPSGSQRWFAEFAQKMRDQPLMAKTSNLRCLAISGSRNAVIRRHEQDHGARAGLTAFGRQSQSQNPSHQITALELGPVTFESLVDLVDMLFVSFPGLQRLACGAHFQDATQPVDEMHGQSTRTPLLPDITTIDLTAPSTSTIMECFLNQDTFSTVTSLSLSQLSSADFPVLERFLHTPDKSALQALILKFDSTSTSGISFDILAQRLDMTQLRALRQLIIDTSPDMPAQAVYTVLSTLSSTALERLHISLHLTQEVSCVDELLTSERFPKLKEVIMPAEDLATGEHFLPLCMSRNVLRGGLSRSQR